MMKNKKVNFIFFIITSILLIFYASDSHAQDQGISLEISQDKMIDLMEEALKAQVGQGDEQIRKRIEKREKARKLQKAGEKVNKKVKKYMSPISNIGSTGGIIASATGDPHLKMLAATFKVTVNAVGGLGKGISAIMVGIGRYQERSQEILSVTEVLLEDMQKSIETIRKFQKKQRFLLVMEKTPQPSKSSSAKQLAKGLYDKITKTTGSIENKIREKIDPLTNEKANREKKLKSIQVSLKEEKEHFSEVVKLLQIKLLQDAVKEIDKKISPTETIEKLKKDIEFYNIAKTSLSGNGSQAKKQFEEIEEKTLKASQSLNYYLDFQKSPGEETPEKLVENKSQLIEKIRDLTNRTKMRDSLYLQDKGIDPDAQLDKATIVALYREIDKLKEQIKKLSEAKTPPSSRPLPSLPRGASPFRPLS